jgi:YD repeat-containing protein
MFVLLLSACGPAQNKPKPETTSPVGSKAKVPASAPTATPVKFIPPALAVPTRTSPQADTAPVSLPPQQHKDTLEIAMTPTPAVVALNGLVKLTVDVHNYSSQLYSGLTYSDTLEKGLAYIPNPLSKVAYDDQSQEISYTIDSLPAGQEITFSYSVKVTEFNQNDHNGEVWLHRGELTNAGNVDLSAHAAFVVGMAGLAPDASIAAVQPQGGWYSAGAVSVFMPKNTFKQDGVLIAAPKANTTGKGPAIEYSLSVVNTGVLAEDQSGNIAEQRTPVKNTASSQFNSPVTLQINLDKVGDLRNIPAGQEPYVATYDETNKIWVKVPIQTVDAADNDVTVETTHFSTWGAGLGSSMPQNGTEALLFSEPYTSLFTGAAEYSIPIWTPTALPGMTPNISLSYSSSTVDGVLGDVQAPWVGMGWNIDGTEIVRKITTDDNGYGYENSFALTLNGAEYDLTQDTNHPSRYYVQQNGFLYIVRHNYSLGNEADALNNVPVGNPTGEWWEVVTTDGTRYRLGWNPDSQQLAPMYGYSCTGGSSCLSPDGVYASIGYAGTATNLVTRRWRVDLVTDAHNNFIQYAYQKYQPPSSSNVLAYDRESYLKSISYGGTPGSPAYQVIFALGDRSTIGDVPNLYNVWDYIDTKYLQSIQINCLICTFGSGGNPVRTYQMNYSLAQAPNANGSLTLTSITISGGGFTEGGISVPQASTATVNFTYTNLPNRAPHGTNEQFNYPRLTQIDNGYGGKLTYTYETDGRDYTSWYNYRVLNAQVDSGMGLAAYQKYTYPMSPAYVGAGTNPNAGGLIGYPTVIESVLDYNNGNTSLLDTTHTFGTTGLDIGRELSTVLTSGGTALEKTINTYITDNSQAPFPGWNYRYLARTDSFVGSAGILTLTSSTTYQNDPATGNLLVQSDYLGSTLYRSTYYEYLVNSAPSVYILSTVSRKVVTDANNIVSSDVHYDYDSTINTPPTKGDLTLIQTLTGNGNQTVDASFGYDNYGNQTSAILYNVNGTLGTAPSASNSYAMTTTNFDTTKSTYRVSQSDPLGETTTTDYLYSLGMPYQVTDANNWTTKTTYDGLGRTLSTQAPGLNQAGVLYTYPTPNSSNKVGAPYAIQMQILDVPAGVYRSVFGMYDGLGRIIQNQIYDADQGQVLLTETAFNAQGKPSRQSQPHYASMSAGWYLAPNWANLNYTASEFDGLGRTTKVTTPGNLVTRTSYSGLTTTVMDPNGNLQSSTSDGLGRQVQLQEYNGTTLYATTQYAYDIANRLIQTKDAQGNVTTLTYNQLGQKIGMSDPDMGNWSYQYDVAGNLSQQTDANGQTLAFTYDKLNRLTQKVQKIANQNDAVLATYAYGDSAGQYGMRVAMTDQSSSPSNTWIYSNFGRTVLQKQIIGGVEKDFTTNSDWLGRPLTATNPDGETISYSYDALGRAKNFSSSAYASTTLASLAYNALSQITSEALGNGANISNAYDATTGRLTSRQANTNATVTPTATPLMNFSYSYDNNGNITQIQDGTLNENATYTYDGLNRLTHANSTNTSTLASIYNQNYTYDKLGDILWVGPGSQAAVIGQGSDMAFSLLPGANAASAELAALQLKPYLDDSTTATATPLATSTPTNIPSNTPFPTPTSTFTLTPSFTPTLNGSQTNTPTSSKTLTPSNSPTRTNTPTITKTPTQVTYTATKTPTPTFTSTPTTGLMGYWSFDDINGTTVPDDTGRGNAGTLSSGAQSFSPGESGTAMHFDGSTNGYVKIPYDSDLAPAGSFLVSAWVNPDSITIGRNTRMLDRDGVFQLGFNTNGYLQFQISGLTPAQVVGPQLPLNQWTLVTASYDSSAKQMSLYVNGILVAAVVATSGTPATNGNSFYLGSSNLSERYRGFLDEVRFYNVLPATPTPTITLVATNTGTQVSSATLIPTLTPTFTP